MKQDGLYAGEDQGSYVLPVCNVDEERRNFIGYNGSVQYYTLDDIQKGDEPGTTDTDYATHGVTGKGYSTINRTQGPRGIKTGVKEGIRATMTSKNVKGYQ